MDRNTVPLGGGNKAVGSGSDYLLNRSMLIKTYSPLSKFSSCAFIMISRTESGEAHNTTTTHANTCKVPSRS